MASISVYVYSVCYMHTCYTVTVLIVLITTGPMDSG